MSEPGVKRFRLQDLRQISDHALQNLARTALESARSESQPNGDELKRKYRRTIIKPTSM